MSDPGGNNTDSSSSSTSTDASDPPSTTAAAAAARSEPTTAVVPALRSSAASSNAARNARNAAVRASTRARETAYRTAPEIELEQDQEQEQEQEPERQGERQGAPPRPLASVSVSSTGNDWQRDAAGQQLFVSYVTNSAAGTGRWETRVDLGLDREGLGFAPVDATPLNTDNNNNNNTAATAATTNTPLRRTNRPSQATINARPTQSRYPTLRRDDPEQAARLRASTIAQAQADLERGATAAAARQERRQQEFDRESLQAAGITASERERAVAERERDRERLRVEAEQRREEGGATSTRRMLTTRMAVPSPPPPAAAAAGVRKSESENKSSTFLPAAERNPTPGGHVTADHPPPYVTLRQLWNFTQPAAGTTVGRQQSSTSTSTSNRNNANTPAAAAAAAGGKTSSGSTSTNNTAAATAAGIGSAAAAAAAAGVTHQRWTEEQVLKNLVVDYLSHAGYPGTVAVLLGLGLGLGLGARPGSAQGVTNSVGGRAGGMDKDKEEEDDVYMLSASTTMHTLDDSTYSSSGGSVGSPGRLSLATASAVQEGNGKKDESGSSTANEGRSGGRFDARLFVKQIEWRKEIRELIIDGRISDATALVRKRFPRVLDTTRDVYRPRRARSAGSSSGVAAALLAGAGAADDEDEDMERDDHPVRGHDDEFDHDDDEEEEEEDDDDDEINDDTDENDAEVIGGGYVFGRTPIPTPYPGFGAMSMSMSMSMAMAGPRRRHLHPTTGNNGSSSASGSNPTSTANNNNNSNSSGGGGTSSRALVTESRQPRYGAGGFPIPVAAPGGGATNANAARGGTGSRFGMMTASGGTGGGGSGGGGGGRSNGLGATASASSLGGSTGDVQWTVHPRTTSTVTTAGVQSGTTTMLPCSSSGVTSTSHSSDPQHFMSGIMRIPAFPYARTYDRPTLLALNMDIQEFVEGLRVLQQQVPSSPSEAVSLAGSMYDEATSNGAGRPNGGGGGGSGGDGTTEVITGASKALLPTADDHPMTSRPSTPNPANPSLSGTATRKAARDAAILACLSHAARLDSATQHLRPREGRRYAQQVQDVCGLLAYNDMEASPLAGYLEQERRVGLADMVEGCIMASTGYSAQSVLESLWQQDAYLWHPEHGHLALNDVSFSETDGAEGEEGKRMRELASSYAADTAWTASGLDESPTARGPVVIELAITCQCVPT
ncbi:hypothetical protein QFC22_005009 [Naganishia vaughanmartiniae]|uniref:Uncharacterized protein n=1 Tax=Naganishia vaughanmartiniae TaxID=1424756 RepID=A0ACC2WW48_9TREE|nr:hypothetical protein QFC22_005009 [Naganishia vaughanmartiniae]